MQEFNTNALSQLLQNEGISEAELSRRIGVSRACINRIIKGQREPSSKVLAGIKQAFPDYSLDYFFAQSVTDRCHQTLMERAEAI